jgi:16S rRNA (guanine527-N7)-methyltransferase
MALNRPELGWLPLCQRVAEAVIHAVQADANAAATQPSVFALESLAGGNLAAGSIAEKLERFFDLLVQWNAQLDLTAARSNEELVDLFLADALFLACVAPRESQWIDVGSGAGAPGLVLKLLRPDLRVRLVEPKTKRVTFLRTALGSLGLSGVEVSRCLSKDMPDCCTGWGVSRATLPPAEWLLEGKRLAREGVWVLLAQGEVPSCPGVHLEHCVTYHWPLTAVERRAALFVPG